MPADDTNAVSNTAQYTLATAPRRGKESTSRGRGSDTARFSSELKMPPRHYSATDEAGIALLQERLHPFPRILGVIETLLGCCNLRVRRFPTLRLGDAAILHR